MYFLSSTEPNKGSGACCTGSKADPNPGIHCVMFEVSPCKEGFQPLFRHQLASLPRNHATPGSCPSIGGLGSIAAPSPQTKHLNFLPRYECSIPNSSHWDIRRHLILPTMSIEIEKILAAAPATTRGQPTQLSCDPKGERIAYAVRILLPMAASACHI